MKKEVNKTIVRKQVYKIEVTHFSDGSMKWHRQNNGFSVVELLGMISMVKANLLGLISESMAPKPNAKLKSTNSPLLHSQKTLK